MLDFEEIVQIEEVGEDDCYDIMLLEKDLYLDEPNFIANDIVVHNCGMDKRYVERKKGREKYEIHHLIKPILEKTYGVMIYQEQIMQILHVVGEIPLKDCEAVRKAISKKKIESIEKYKDMFIKNGQKNLSFTKEQMEEFFNQILSWSEYGFNKTLTEDTIINCVDGAKQIKDICAGDIVYSINEKGEQVQTEVVAVHDHGVVNVVEATFDDGYVVRCTYDHKFLTEEGQVPLWLIVKDNMVVLSSPLGEHAGEEKEWSSGKVWTNNKNSGKDERASRELQGVQLSEVEAGGKEIHFQMRSGISVFTSTGPKSSENWRNEFGVVHFTPEYASITNTRNLVSRRILRVVTVGKRQCYDLEVAISTHNFILPNGIITSNSHAVAYTYISMYLLYLKVHYPHEFYASMLSCETLAEKIKDIKMEAKIHGVEMHRLDINKSGINFELKDNLIYFGFSNVKGIGEGPAQKIVAGQPYRSFEDFLYRCGTDASMLKPILGLRCFRDRDPITLWKFAEHFKECFKKNEEKRKRFGTSLDRYEDELRELIPEVEFKLSDLSGDSPFDNIEYQQKYDKEEEITVLKEYECKEGDGVGRIEMVYVPVDGTDVVIEREVMRYYKKIATKRPWNRWKDLKNLWNKRKRTIARFSDADFKTLPRLIDFDPDQYDIPKDLAKEFKNPVVSEEKFYGFAWVHELERSPDYRGNLTFDSLRSDIDSSSGPVELRVKKVIQMTSKKGSTYSQVLAEDVTGQENKINVWSDDWDRWHKELSEGNLIRIRLQPPSGGFNTFLLESNQNGKYRGQKRYRDKDDDPRVIVMRVGLKEEEKFMTDEEVLELFNNLGMENKND